MVLTILAALVVWVALVAPDQPKDLTLSGFLRIPLEGLVLIALAAVLPRTPRRILAVSCGLLLALVVVLKVINYEMFTLYDRPYDPLGDTSQLGNGIETLRSLVGGTETKLIEVGAVVGTVVAGRRADAGDAAADPGCGRATAAGRCGRSRGSALSGRSAGRSALSSSPTRRSPPRCPPVWSSTRSMRFGRTSTTRACSPSRSSTTRSATPPPTGC